MFFFLLTKAKTPYKITYYLLPAHSKEIRDASRNLRACNWKDQEKIHSIIPRKSAWLSGNFTSSTLIRVWVVETIQYSMNIIPWIPLVEKCISCFQSWLQEIILSNLSALPFSIQTTVFHALPFRTTFLPTFSPAFPRVLKFI